MSDFGSTRLGWFLGIAITPLGWALCAIAFWANCAHAQVTPDGTLPNNSSTVIQLGNPSTIKFVDVSQQIDTRCNPGSKYKDSSFIITGRGGLPPNPKDILTPDAIEVGWVTLNPEIEKNSRTKKISVDPPQPTPEPIVEATGWVINEKGQVVFTADATPHGSWQNPVSCHAS
jgi:large exoprotein involved in heme utilization and adhesion